MAKQLNIEINKCAECPYCLYDSAFEEYFCKKLTWVFIENRDEVHPLCPLEEKQTLFTESELSKAWDEGYHAKVDEIKGERSVKFSEFLERLK
jgi:hypothetical protein